METITTVRGFRQVWTSIPKPIGLVPTMGSLHAGHISLLRRARTENETVVASLFVNPTQFGNDEDFNDYPRDVESDMGILQSEGVDIVFIPTAEEMYPEGFTSSVNVGNLGGILEGQFRPGHFTGVATIVSKLMSICRPDRSYFGQKDAQQCAVIKRMVDDLNLGTEVRVCPIVRNEDGVALSSRNSYLSADEYESAKLLSSSLFHARSVWSSQQKQLYQIKEIIKSMLECDSKILIEYISFNDIDTFAEVRESKDKMVVCIAVKIGNTRLIDNLTFE